jgi:prevent-host-death family protein
VVGPVVEAGKPHLNVTATAIAVGSRARPGDVIRLAPNILWVREGLAWILPSGHIGHVEKRSFADVKAHLSEIVDQAEHRGKKILILRHGKPAAAIVPASVARGSRPRRVLSRKQADRRLDELAVELAGDPSFSAVADLLEGRR